MRYLVCLSLVLSSTLASAQIPRHERRAMRRAAQALWPEAAGDRAKLDALIDRVAGVYDGRDEEDRVTRMRHLAKGVVDAVHRAGSAGATDDDLRVVLKNVLRAHQLDAAHGRNAANAVTARTLIGLATLLGVASAADLGYLAHLNAEGVDPLLIGLATPVPPLYLAGFFYAFGREYPPVVPGTGIVGRALDRTDYLREFEAVLAKALADAPAWVDATTDFDEASPNILRGVTALVDELWGAGTRLAVCEALLAAPAAPQN